MPYVPPHLRGGSAPPSASNSAARPPSTQRDDRGPSSSAAFGGFGGSSRKEPERAASQNGVSNGIPRSNSSKSVAANGTSRSSLKVAPWKPSDRVAAMTSEQVVETRRRLNISVEAEGEDFVTICPIESFVDMVRTASQAQLSFVSR